MLVSLSAAAALQDHLTHIGLGQIRNDESGRFFTQNRSDRNSDDQVRRILTMTILTAAVSTAIRFIDSAVAKIGQGVESFLCYKYDVSALTAVSAIRAAVGYIFLPAKRSTSRCRLSRILYKS